MMPYEEEAPIPFWDYQDLLLLIGLALPCLLVAALAAKGAGPQTAPWISMFLFYLLWFGCLWSILKMRYGRPFWSSLGWFYPGHAIMLSAATGPLLAIATSFLGLALHTPLVDMPFRKLLEGRHSLALFGVFSVILGPLTEELAFRGFLMPLLSRSMGSAAGVILTAIPFGLMHGAQYGWVWQYMVVVGFAGVVFGFVKDRTGSTMASTALHSAYNLTLYAALVIGGVGL